MKPQEKLAEFQGKLTALLKEYNYELRPQVSVGVFELPTQEATAAPVETTEVPQTVEEPVKEAEIVEEPKNEVI